MSKVKATAAERALQDAMREEGCFGGLGNNFCLSNRYCGTPFVPPEIHHINASSMKRKEWAVIPLCCVHHRQFLSAIHVSKKRFRDEYAHEWNLYFRILNKVIGNIANKHRFEITKKIKEYADSGHASKQFMDEYERVGVEG
jgi:hypothetical protein